MPKTSSTNKITREATKTWKYFSHKLFRNNLFLYWSDFSIYDSFKIIISSNDNELNAVQKFTQFCENSLCRALRMWCFKMFKMVFSKPTTQICVGIFNGKMVFVFTHLEIVNEHGFGACDRSLVYTIPHWFCHCNRASGKLSYIPSPWATLYTHQFYN